MFRRSEQTSFHFGSESQARDRGRTCVEEADYDPESIGYYKGFIRMNNPLYVPRDLGNWSGDECARQILSRRIKLPFELS